MAAMLLTVLDQCSQSLIDPKAAMNAYERALIEAPLARTLERHSAVADHIVRFADPAAVVLGLSLWASRVVQMRRAERQRLVAPPEPYQETPPAVEFRPNDVVGENRPVMQDILGGS